jgi:hypothetical protein
VQTILKGNFWKIVWKYWVFYSFFITFLCIFYYSKISICCYSLISIYNKELRVLDLIRFDYQTKRLKYFRRNNLLVLIFRLAIIGKLKQEKTDNNKIKKISSWKILIFFGTEIIIEILVRSPNGCPISFSKPKSTLKMLTISIARVQIPLMLS